MRSSGCTIQQTLSLESAAVVNQAVSLARRRGHGQVTPLHVANAMLSSSSSAGLLRQACVQSHTHPLQCRALELCFNVALNRLPAASTSSSPMLSGPHLHPSISNSLIAAFKRAQAHQRRGSIENQQQQQQHQQHAILAVKTEVEQLIISILDDPSVSRVMREAGFSSTLVKARVEQAISMKIMSSNNTKSPHDDDDDDHDHGLGDIKESCSSKDWSDRIRTEDISSVIEGLFVSGKKKRCCVVVGECIANLEGAIKGAMDGIKSGGDHSFGDTFKDVRFELLPLDSFQALSRNEFELKTAEITRTVNRNRRNGLVLYLGDLRWAIDFRKGGGDDMVEYMIKELKRLVLECNSEFERIWLVGVATFQTYTRFGSGNSSLEAIWGLHAITIPAGSLGLDLIPQSDSLASKTTNGTLSWLEIKDNSEPTTPSLPSWLQKCKDENKGLNHKSTKQDSIPRVKDLCKSWSFSETTLSFSSPSPPSSSEFSNERQQWFNPEQTGHPAIEVEPFQTTLSMYVTSSISSSDVNVKEMQCTQKRFNDYNSFSLETLCYALESKVPWQKEIVRDVATTVLNCRSRKLRRKEDTWFFFLGDDVNGKERIGRELARLVFGSENKYISIGLSSFSSKEDSGNKRLRDEQSFTFTDRIMEAILVDPHRVLFVEDIEQMDYVSQVGIKRAIERGKIRSSCNGKEVSLEDAIIILSCERFSSRSRACSPSTKQHHNHHYQGRPREEEKVGFCSNESNGNPINSSRVSLDLNISISDNNAFDDQIHMDRSYVDELGLVGCVDKCILFKL
ncbi:hypothetical protein V2J09_007012 [Rumex salicifolius]